MTKPECGVEGCTRCVWSRGLCSTHYSLERRRAIRDGTWDQRPKPDLSRPWMRSHFDLCGAGTHWGCGRKVTHDAHILMNGRRHTAFGLDDGHVLFHAECSPAVVDPTAVRLWRGSYTGRRIAALSQLAEGA